jgi:hypothetical protein
MDMVYEGMNIRAQGLEDMKALLKEYARSGYRLLHNYQETGFEELWSNTFPTNREENDCSAVSQHLQPTKPS